MCCTLLQVIMVQNVSFRYSDTTPLIYKDLEFGIDLDTRLALVGPNGAGKSTLLKLLYGELNPSTGMIRKNTHLRIARYHQHLHELLDLDLSPIDYMMKQFPELKERDEVCVVIFMLKYSEVTISRLHIVADFTSDVIFILIFSLMYFHDSFMLFSKLGNLPIVLFICSFREGCLA